jgi:hypothetical protein
VSGVTAEEEYGETETRLSEEGFQSDDLDESDCRQMGE